jgi:UDP-N-acetylglucosamine:LPS N-acetylglucosamine transferase
MKNYLREKKVLAVASGGGHWVQMLRIRAAFAHCDVSYVSTNPEYAKDVEGRMFTVTDATMWNKLRLMRMFLQVAWIVWRVRPHVVISTGAAPGFAAIVFGHLLGAKTIWIDSIANSETLSKSGQKAGGFADIWLTQWQHLESDKGPTFWGSVI